MRLIDADALIHAIEDIKLYNVTPGQKPFDMNRVRVDELIEIVKRLAEEYNNDFCEWHKVKNGNAYKCNTHAEIHDSRVLDWFVCPYCGKKIKVVE